MTVPWTPLAAIGLVCLVGAVLGSVLTTAAALRDPGQPLARHQDHQSRRA